MGAGAHLGEEVHGARRASHVDGELIGPDVVCPINLEERSRPKRDTARRGEREEILEPRRSVLFVIEVNVDRLGTRGGAAGEPYAHRDALSFGPVVQLPGRPRGATEALALEGRLEVVSRRENVEDEYA